MSQTFVIDPALGVDENGVGPVSFTLSQNYPNPFNPTTSISFTLSRASSVTLGVYDVKGALVAMIVDGLRQAGPNSVTFDATSLPSGSYEYRLTTPNGNDSKWMTLTK
jgi:hypothetical protein